MYTDILYPTDGSTGSNAAAEHVRLLASMFDATVHVLCVVDTRHVGIGMSAFLDEGTAGMSGSATDTEGGTVGERDDADERQAELREHGESVVKEASAAFGDIETTTAVMAGNPHTSILEYADDHDIDLIVMGTHGRTGVDRYLLGSVTEKVIRMSDAPVMTVRAGVED